MCHPPCRRRFQPNLQILEDRTVPSTVSVTDASVIEGSQPLKFIDRFVPEGSGGLFTPRSAIFGPDGNGDGIGDLYVPSASSNEVLRYDGITGAFIDAFVTAGSGGLNSPGGLAFGADGNLYVSSFSGNQVLRYDGVTGAFIDAIASGLNGPLGITTASDGALYIANQDANEILKYDSSGLSTFINAGSGGLAMPRNAMFGPDGNGDGYGDLYVASRGSEQVLRYDGRTGASLGVFASVPNGPIWLEFGGDGYLYTTARTTTTCCDTSIDRFNAISGAFADSYALGRDGWSFTIGSDGLVYNSANGDGNFVERFGTSSVAVFTVTLDAASPTPVTLDYATASGAATSGSDFTPVSGTLTFAPGQTTRTILVPTLDDATAEPTETFSLNLSNANGATIIDNQGLGTIQDNDATKFYVVDDAASNKSFNYGRTGLATGSFGLIANNSAPRGAASSAAGTKLWTIDANKAVYVYNPSGTLLGSWSAGNLSGAAQVEGIATNGTDVWVVDNKQDKIFRYAGAASRLSGSQNAASSFSLNSGNSNPKDIVTDGTSIWVVNDGTADTVFKYTLTGTLLGSWTIDAANASPTGITLDPTNVNHLWVVDNGTDRIYQYDGAASRTSGSQSASTSFALTAGNTNPQGIADPPPTHAKPKPMPSPRSRMTTLGSRLSDADLAALLGMESREHKSLTDHVFQQKPQRLAR